MAVGNGAQVYFADAGHGNTVSEWSWNPTSGWQQAFFSGDQLTRGSSPDPVLVGTTTQVYFADAARGNTVTKWYDDPSTGMHQTYLFADRLAPGRHRRRPCDPSGAEPPDVSSSETEPPKHLASQAVGRPVDLPPGDPPGIGAGAPGRRLDVSQVPGGP